MSDKYEHLKVRLKGQDLVWIAKDRRSGPLAPTEHIAEDGRLDILAGLFGVSFAYIQDGEIWKEGKVIGKIDDLEIKE